MKNAIKLLENNRIGGYLIVFGSSQQKDLQGEYFTPETELCLDWYDQRPALYHHGLDGAIKGDAIGIIDTLKVDNVGVWAEAQLDMRQRYVSAVLSLVDKGVLGWSSGSLPHLVEVESDGRIKRWPVLEGSLTPTPAEPRRTDIHRIKSIYTDLGLSLERLALPDNDNTPDNAIDAEEPPARERARKDGEDVLSDSNPNTSTGELEMNLEQIIMMVLEAIMSQGVNLTDEQKQMVIQQVTAAMKPPEGAAVDSAPMDEQKSIETAKAVTAKVSEAIKGILEETKRREQAVREAAINAFKGITQDAPPASKAGNYQPPAPAPRIDMLDRRFDYHQPEDLVFGVMVLQQSAKKGLAEPPSEEFLRAAAYKVLKAAEKDHPVYGHRAVKSAMPAVKADEIVATNLSSYGQNWVGVAYENRLWEKVRQATIYQQLISRGIFQVEVPQGVNSVYIPTEGTDPTWYTLVEQNDLTSDEFAPVTPKASTPTATRRQLTVGGIAARVVFTDFMEEDALFPVLAFYRDRMEVSAQEQIEYVIFNGDTATGANTNINLIDGTPSVDSKGRGPAYLAIDGIMKLPLVTTTALSRDAGADFDETDFSATMGLLGAALRADKKRLLFAVDSTTALKALDITVFKTRDVYSRPTLEEGVLLQAYGVDVFESGQIALANTAGKISGTGSNNVKGRIACIRPDQWALGWKRNVKTEAGRDIDAQSTSVVSTMRFGITYRNASDGVGLSYNVNVSS